MSQLICIPSAFFYSGPQRIGCHFFECLFSGLWIQTLISSGNTLTGTPEKRFTSYLVIIGPVKLMHKISHHDT